MTNLRTLAAAGLAGVSAFTTTTISHENYDDTLVYLPEGYDPSTQYPVVYFLHGRGQEEASTTRRILPGKPGLRFEQSLDDDFSWAFGAVSGTKLTNLVDERQYILVAPLANRVDPDPECQPGIGGFACRSWNSDSINKFTYVDNGFALPGATFDGRTCSEKEAEDGVFCEDDNAFLGLFSGLAPGIVASLGGDEATGAFLGANFNCQTVAGLLAQTAAQYALLNIPVPVPDCSTDLSVFDASLAGVSLATLCPVTCQACPETRCFDDEQFLVDLVAEVQSTFNTDSRRTHISGYSSGAFMSYQMICNHAELFAGAFTMNGPLDLDPAAICNPSEPVSVLQYHTTNDFVVPSSTARPTFVKSSIANGCEDPSLTLATPALPTLDTWTDVAVPSVATLDAILASVGDDTARFVLSQFNDQLLQFEFPAIPGVDTIAFEASECPEGITSKYLENVGGNHQLRINDNFPAAAFDFFDGSVKRGIPEYGRCGGIGFEADGNGATICVTGTACEEKGPYYSQCLRLPEVEGTVRPWGQCGGIGFNGSSECAVGYECVEENDYYSQCKVTAGYKSGFY